GDQILSATVYFDKLQSGEVTQLLSSLGHHTLGLRLQRRGERSPLAGQGWGQDPLGTAGAEVVLSGDDEEYRRIYSTKIKPRLKAEELPAGGSQSRTITVTRRVTAYTVDVTGPEPDPQPLPQEPSVKMKMMMMKKGPGEAGEDMEGQKLPEGQQGWGGTGRELQGPLGGGSLQGPGLEVQGGAGGLGVTSQGHGSSVGLQGGPQGAEVGRVKIPVLQMPKFGFSTQAEAPQVVATDLPPRVEVTSSTTPTKGPQPQGVVDLEVDLKGAKVQGAPAAAVALPGGTVKIPQMSCPKFSVLEPPGGGPRVEMAAPKAQVGPPEVTIKGPGTKQVEAPQISLSDVDLRLRAPQAQLEGDQPQGLKVDLKAPALQLGSPEGAWEGLHGAPPGLEVKGPELKATSSSLRGPQVGVDLPGVGTKGSTAEVKVKAPQISVPEVELKGPNVKGDLDVAAPQLRAPEVDIHGPEVDIHGPEGKVKMPKLKMPKFGVPGMKGEGPSLDVTLPKAEVDISAPKVDIKGPKVDVEAPEVDLRAPEVDLRAPEVDLKAPEVDIHGPEGKVKMPKLKMPKFGVPGMKGEGPSMDVTLPKAEVDISAPQVDISAPQVDISAPQVDVEVPKVD
ncbi:AHNK protein, partial [Tricholaema leucomelas]|nr:AHNK protein [Tricholaema leucomelas]